MKSLFKPRSIAVVGASNDPFRIIGAMAGSHAVHQGFFRQKGICLVSDMDKLFGVAHLLSRYGSRGGHRLAILSVKGEHRRKTSRSAAGRC